MRHAAPFALAALLWLPGCPSEQKEAPPPEKKDVPFKVYVSLRERVTDLPAEGLELSLDGKSIGKLTADEPLVTVELPADTFGVDLAERLTAAVPTSCGPEKVEVRPYYATKKAEEEYREKYATGDQKQTMSFSVAPSEEAFGRPPPSSTRSAGAAIVVPSTSIARWGQRRRAARARPRPTRANGPTRSSIPPTSSTPPRSNSRSPPIPTP